MLGLCGVYIYLKLCIGYCWDTVRAYRYFLWIFEAFERTVITFRHLRAEANVLFRVRVELSNKSLLDTLSKYDLVLGVTLKQLHENGKWYHLLLAVRFTCAVFVQILLIRFPYLPGIMCPPIVASSYVEMSSQERMYGTRVVFSCPGGQRIVGASSITCLRNETWSDMPPNCEGKIFVDICPISNTQYLLFSWLVLSSRSLY